MKYYLLPYYSAVEYPNIWDSVAVAPDFYPNEFLGNSEGKNGASTPIWGKGVAYVICKDAAPTEEMTDIIESEKATWNLANPDNQTGTMQMIFEESEKHLIAEQLATRQEELIILGVV